MSDVEGTLYMPSRPQQGMRSLRRSMLILAVIGLLVLPATPVAAHSNSNTAGGIAPYTTSASIHFHSTNPPTIKVDGFGYTGPFQMTLHDPAGHAHQISCTGTQTPLTILMDLDSCTPMQWHGSGAATLDIDASAGAGHWHVSVEPN